MNDMEIALVCFVNELHRGIIYRNEKYQMLHGIKYQKNMPKEYLEKIREAYQSNCFEAAYELKTYYMENGLLSNTIVLKMRPDSPEKQEIKTIKVHSELEETDKEYAHHVIEVFQEHGKYKVLDVLHTDKVVWLESYLDALCEVNHCKREQLRYDMGYLAPCHAFAANMAGLTDFMRYLDKKYRVGSPRVTLVNVDEKSEEGMLLSDDLAMDFDAFGKLYGCTGEEVIAAFPRVYDRLMACRFNMLHAICMGYAMRNPAVTNQVAEAIFDDAKMCELMDGAPTIPGHAW